MSYKERDGEHKRINYKIRAIVVCYGSIRATQNTILFLHAMDQVYKFGGIADMVEDFVEKAHQEGKKLDHLVARMSSQSFRQQELVKIHRQWLKSDPDILSQICKFYFYMQWIKYINLGA